VAPALGKAVGLGSQTFEHAYVFDVAPRKRKPNRTAAAAIPPTPTIQFRYREKNDLR
jgi:hypothetical protein